MTGLKDVAPGACGCGPAGLGREHQGLRLPRRKVLIKQLSDGRLVMEHKGGRLKFEELKARPVATKAKKVIVNNRQYKPPANHPWKGKPMVGGPPAVTPAPAAPARESQQDKNKAR